MNQKEWVSYFKAAYGRDPEPQEFSKALNSGEFIIDPTVQIPQSTSKSSTAHPEQSFQQIFHENGPDARLIKKDIQKAEDEVLALFAELGLQVYLQHINKESESLDVQMNKILDANKAVYSLKTAYNEVTQYGRICLSCGQKLGDNDRYCSNCGSDSEFLEKAAAENIQSCSLCATKQDGNHQYCACCGLKF